MGDPKTFHAEHVEPVNVADAVPTEIPQAAIAPLGEHSMSDARIDARYQEMIQLGAKALGYSPPTDGLLGSGMSKMLAESNAKYVLDAAGVPALLERIVVVDIDGRTVLMDNVAECEAALDSVQEANERSASECEKLKAALAAIANGDPLPCSECGEPHTYTPNGSVSKAGSWAAADGHAFYPIAVYEFAARALVGSVPPTPNEEPRCPECNGGWGTYTTGEKAGEKVPHCDNYCSMQGAGRGGDWKHGDAR